MLSSVNILKRFNSVRRVYTQYTQSRKSKGRRCPDCAYCIYAVYTLYTAERPFKCPPICIEARSACRGSSKTIACRRRSPLTTVGNRGSQSMAVGRRQSPYNIFQWR
nr:MAG TPA: hypothetical protein [Caudoviricetes sp.]